LKIHKAENKIHRCSFLQTEELQVLVSESQKPSASSECFEKLREKLELAKELNISKDRLQNAQGSLERLEHRLQVFS